MLITFVFPMIFYVSIIIGSVILIGIDYDFVSEAHAVDKSFTITIPRGAANPEVDITKLGPRQWYVPNQITVTENDTITWVNDDTEGHTVTSGSGAGLESLLTNRKGTENGLFDSGLFGPGENWTLRFEKSGRYSYFCTVHPWMEGLVIVQAQIENIPDYPVDAEGKKQAVFPVHTLTNDDKYDIDMAWTPRVLLTGEEVSFILDFSDPLTNKRHHLLPYEFTILQNEKELVRTSGLSEVGSDTQHYIFSEPGPINMRVENVGNDNYSFTEFSSTVYENPKLTAADVERISSHQPTSANLPTNPFKVNTLTLITIIYVVIIGIPAATATVYILYRKGKI
ncbi:MAG: plastocyanin/azurin family copper-binding protein [Nitrososphaeraceae archaeon]